MVFCELINVHFPGSENFSEPIKTLLTTISKYTRGIQHSDWQRLRGMLGAGREEKHATQTQTQQLPLSKGKNTNKTLKQNTNLASASPEQPA